MIFRCTRGPFVGPPCCAGTGLFRGQWIVGYSWQGTRLGGSPSPSSGWRVGISFSWPLRAEDIGGNRFDDIAEDVVRERYGELRRVVMHASSVRALRHVRLLFEQTHEPARFVILERARRSRARRSFDARADVGRSSGVLRSSKSAVGVLHSQVEKLVDKTRKFCDHRKMGRRFALFVVVMAACSGCCGLGDNHEKRARAEPVTNEFSSSQRVERQEEPATRTQEAKPAEQKQLASPRTKVATPQQQQGATTKTIAPRQESTTTTTIQPAAPKEPAAGRVCCCDGSVSPTCTTVHRGCCSHHGGVCACD